MKHCLIPLFCMFLFARASCLADVLEIGRNEAARLRESYKVWAKSPKNVTGVMHVPAAQLSAEARTAEFRSANVDPDSEMLMTLEDENSAEGFLYDYASGAQLADFEDQGYSFTQTSEWDVLHFRFKAKKKPNQRPDPTPGKSPVSNQSPPPGVAHH